MTNRYIMRPNGRQVLVDEAGRPVKEREFKAGFLLCAGMISEDAYREILEEPAPVIERRFCGCGQEVWSRRNGEVLDYVCSDCFGMQSRCQEPLDTRIKAAQPDVEECAWQTATSEGP